MHFKHLFAFFLIIAGMGLTPLFFFFMSDEQSFNPLFLLCLGICAIAFLFSGLFILKRSR
jgi:hypothetical protein